MTNEQILKKAIDKVIANGWNPIDDMGKVYEFVIHRADCHWKAIWIEFFTKDGDGGQLDLTRLIFDHDFAKAFWGSDVLSVCCGEKVIEEYNHYKCPQCKRFEWEINYLDAWQYHLQQMVIEPESLKYLEKFL